MLCLSAYADDANWMAVGDAGNFSKNRFISMDREDVRITVGDSVVHVKATFWFRNHGPATKVTMAFPDETSKNSADPKGNAPAVMQAIKSTVDGVAAPLVRKPLNSKGDYIKSAWIKTVAFNKGQTRKVVVEYDAANGFAGNGWVINSYILTTGATWRGKIGECALSVDWRGLKTLSRPWLELVSMTGKPGPKVNWQRIGPRQVRTVLHNIEPTYDLDLTMIQGYWNFTMNGKKMVQNLGATTTDSGVTLEGRPSDIRIAVANIPDFFGSHTDQNHPMTNPVVRGYGKRVTLEGSKVLVMGSKKFKLKRKAVKPNLGDDNNQFVYLRDVIEAMGGKYRYNRLEERVEITLPIPAKKR